MATVNYTVEQPSKGVTIVTWAALANGDNGTPFETVCHEAVSAQVVGTFGSGGTVVVEGSLYTSSPTYAVLNDVANAALSFTAAKIEGVQEKAYRYRPNVTAGDGSTALTVKLLLASGAN